MRVLILAAVAALAIGPVATAAPVCKTGIPCGNSCISKDKVCHKTAATASAASSAAAAKPAAAATTGKCKANGKYVKCGTPGAAPAK